MRDSRPSLRWSGLVIAAALACGCGTSPHGVPVSGKKGAALDGGIKGNTATGPQLCCAVDSVPNASEFCCPISLCCGASGCATCGYANTGSGTSGGNPGGAPDAGSTATRVCPASEPLDCGDGHCCDKDHPNCCSDGSCCDDGHPYCCGNGTCCDKDHPFCCANGTCADDVGHCPSGCPAGFAPAQAVTATSECCPVGLPYLCNDGSCDSVPSCHAQGLFGGPNPAVALNQTSSSSSACKTPSNITGTWTGCYPVVSCGSCSTSSPSCFSFTISADVAQSGGAFSDDQGNTYTLDLASCRATVNQSSYGGGTTGSTCGAAAGTTVIDLGAKTETTPLQCPTDNCRSCGNATAPLSH